MRNKLLRATALQATLSRSFRWAYGSQKTITTPTYWAFLKLML